MVLLLSSRAIITWEICPFRLAEEAALSKSLAAYRVGDVVGALTQYPTNFAAASDNARVYHAALLLGVGEAAQAETILDGLANQDPSSRARRLGDALRLLISAVKRQTAPGNITPELATEFLAASYYEQSRAKGDESLNRALDFAQKAARRACPISATPGNVWPKCNSASGEPARPVRLFKRAWNSRPATPRPSR